MSRRQGTSSTNRYQQPNQQPNQMNPTNPQATSSSSANNSSGYSSRNNSQKNAPANHYTNFQSHQKHDLNQIVKCPGTHKRYFASDFLGKGGFAKVYRLRKLDRFECIVPSEALAIKVVQKSTIRKDHQRQKMALEIKLHKKLNHGHIVQFVSSFEDEERVFVILEYCQNRSLMEVHKRRKTITQPELRFYMKQILSALIYIHDKNIIHRDLKLSNILLAQGMMVKVCDFGLATTLTELNDKRTTLCGTPNYIAPEILNKNGHGKPADVWSTGVAMFALLVGTPPFETSSLTATYRKIKENNYTIPSSYKRQAVGYMIKAMLNPKADQRPSVHKLIQDKFITTGFYPDSMPESAMTCEPHFNHEQSICVYADQNVYSNGRETRSRSRSEIKNQETKASSSRRARVDQNGKMGNNDGQQDHDLLRAPLHEMNNVEINDRARNVLQNEPSTAPTTSEISFPEHGDQRLEGYDKMKKYAHDILSQLKFLDELFSKPTENRGVRFHKKVSDVIDMEDAVDPSIRPVYWISKWVDYSDKYGLGYQLIDESVGVLFNDNRRMILHSNQNHIQAIEEDMVREKMTTAKEIELNFKVSEQKYAKESQIRNSNPRSADEEKFIKLDSDFRQSKDLNKKYKLLKHFRQYMIAHLVTAGDEYKITSIDDLRRLPYLVKWFRTKHAICLMLTNGIVQINFFSCHSKLIFDPSVEAVTYINDKKQLTTFNIKNMQKTGIDTKFFMKLVEGKNLVVSLYKHLHPNSGITGKMIDSGGSLVASLAKAN